MKIAPVSGDLLVKLALLGAMGAGAWYLVQRARASLPAWQMPTLPDFTLPDWPDWATVNPNWVNPASDENLIYAGTSGIVSAATGREETLGGLLHDITHRSPLADPIRESPSGAGPDYDIPGMPPYFGA